MGNVHVSPSIEVLKIEFESVLCGSGEVERLLNGEVLVIGRFERSIKNRRRAKKRKAYN